jgi:hypothetical protein
MPYNSKNDDVDKKIKKKDTMTFKKKKKGGSYIVTWNSDTSSSDDDDEVMMTRPPRRSLLQALPFKRSLLSLTLHHASWLRLLRYKLAMIDVMRNMVMKVKVKVMMNPLKMN